MDRRAGGRCRTCCELKTDCSPSATPFLFTGDTGDAGDTAAEGGQPAGWSAGEPWLEGRCGGTAARVKQVFDFAGLGTDICKETRTALDPSENKRQVSGD